MKKCIIFLLCLSYLNNVQLSASFIVRVPKKFLTQKAALVLYLTDEGKPYIGKYRLDQNSASRKISQGELQMTTDAESDCLGDAIDLTVSNTCTEHDAILCFELDPSKVLRVLVLKDTLLEDDPFGVVEFAASQDASVCQDEEEFDPLSAMVDGIDANAVATSTQTHHDTSVWTKCALYAEIVTMVTYGKAKRAVSDVTTWMYGSK
ncbi:MAG TPA: hypothetical protein VLG50_00440 [Candidatus Saccharimonadales bacterium]|nr:hypothetical protein [Candidatus Saccharimonadales bacterium]